MKPLRRSQRLSTQPQGHPDGQKASIVQTEGGKRRLEDGDCSRDTKRKRYQLTEKNLSRHLKNTRAMRVRKISTNSDSGSIKTRTTATTVSTTTDRRFGPTLIENGVVFEESYTLAPSDCDLVKAALAKPQPLPASAHRHWLNIRASKAQLALGELSLESKVIEAMLSHHEPPLMYERFRNDQWTEVDNELTVGISDPKPDVVESYLWSMYPKGTRDEFDDLAPTQYGYAMPTFAMESKGAGEPGQAVRQAAYDGAVMTHAAIAAESRMGRKKNRLYSKTQAITVTLNPDEICVYANHAVQDQSTGKVAYHHHCVERVRYLASEDNWNTAYSVLRNAQLFALTLADTRVRDIELYFREKDQQDEKLQGTNGKLQTETPVKKISNMGPPSSKRLSTIRTNGPSRRTKDTVAESTGYLAPTNSTQSKGSPSLACKEETLKSKHTRV